MQLAAISVHAAVYSTTNTQNIDSLWLLSKVHRDLLQGKKQSAGAMRIHTIVG
jgi:hypothetical protein